MFKAIVFVEQEWNELKTKIADELYKHFLQRYKLMDRRANAEIVTGLHGWLTEVVFKHFPKAPADQPFPGHIVMSEREWSGVPMFVGKEIALELQRETYIISRETDEEVVERIDDLMVSELFFATQTSMQLLTEKYHRAGV